VNKAELIETVAAQTGCSKASAERRIDAVLKGVSRGLRRDREVRLVGFGTFRVSRRRARTGVNPRSGKPIRIKASSRISFRAGKDLKAFVR
jgi:nucleoid DNA-binding protein